MGFLKMAEVSQVSHLSHVEKSSSKDENDHHKDIPHTAPKDGDLEIFIWPHCKNSVMQGIHCT